MWKVSSYKRRKLILEVNDFIEMCAVKYVRLSIEDLDKIVDEYSKKYPHPRYQLNILEILDLDWEEGKWKTMFGI